MKTKNPVILIIRDGWGYNSKAAGNFIKISKTPNEDFYLKNYPHGLLAASGEAVGLEKGYQGNSEVGHLTLGSGRIIFQAMAQINKAIKDKTFFKNQAFLEVINNCRRYKTSLHLVGLLQTQGVHAHLNHLFALLELCRQQKFKDVLIHVITDGRDAPPTESLKHLRALKRKIKELGFGRIVTVSGRYFAMDRDNRWERTQEAYNCLALGQADEFVDALDYVKASHQAGVSDEFIKPGKQLGYSGLKKNEGIIFFNFRTDRPRQLTKALIDKKFAGFKRSQIPVCMATMTQYYEPLSAAVAFPNISLDNLLGEVIASAGLKQLRISETEKYAHVTFFFNGQKEKPSKGEDRILINSPKVATYDLKPEMSAPEISRRLITEIDKKKYDFIVVNLVNGDMVGHTADKKAIIKAIETVDSAQGEIVSAALKNNYSIILLADHGNAEDKSAKTMTSHTTNPVPVILVSQDSKLNKAKIRRGAGLQDVAPTILKIMGLKLPKEMTGQSFINF